MVQYSGNAQSRSPRHLQEYPIKGTIGGRATPAEAFRSRPHEYGQYHNKPRVLDTLSRSAAASPTGEPRGCVLDRIPARSNDTCLCRKFHRNLRPSPVTLNGSLETTSFLPTAQQLQWLSVPGPQHATSQKAETTQRGRGIETHKSWYLTCHAPLTTDTDGAMLIEKATCTSTL